VTSTPTVFGLIQRDPTTGQFLGTIIGFSHVEFLGTSPAEVEVRLRQHVAELVAGDTLVLDTEFVSVVPLS